MSARSKARRLTTAIMKVLAKINSRSRRLIASRIKLPMPGIEKIFSTTTDPASMAGKIVTNIVISGRRLFRKTWRSRTSRPGTPFALAVRT